MSWGNAENELQKEVDEGGDIPFERRILAWKRSDDMTEIWCEGVKKLVPTSAEAKAFAAEAQPSLCWKPKYSEHQHDGAGRINYNAKVVA